MVVAEEGGAAATEVTAKRGVFAGFSRGSRAVRLSIPGLVLAPGRAGDPSAGEGGGGGGGDTGNA